MPLTSEAKKLLAETIRGTAQNPEKGVRSLLLRALHDEADRSYRLSVPIAQARLDEAHQKRRERLQSWIDERARAASRNDKTARDRFLAQAEKEAAATLLNRLVLLRHLEALGLSRPAVLTGGWNSKGYREFREFAPALCQNGTADATEGYAALLQLVFDELAVDLPGLFGDIGLTRLFPIPASALREVVERLDDKRLASAWTDDTTLGWVYQYWNDPDREALDDKISAGGKIEPHEIASKTQMFTERYMVEWLLQNSLGLTWLCMCRKHGWTADAERVLPGLEARRVDWRAKREAGEVALDALMPIEGELEDHWKYFVPQPIPDDAVEKAPESVRTLKILDPACGSGHFLVIAFGLLTALYREEARHRGETVTDREIAESILENNLFGIDIDPRAIQIAAAALYLKGKTLAKDARPKTIHLVAPVLQLGKLPPNDPAVSLLREDLKRDVGIPEALTNRLLTSLADVDFLGSLLKVDAAVENALSVVDLEFERSQGQGDIFRGFPAQQVKLSLGEAKATVLDKLERFLSQHSKSGDLGLRLDGEQIAGGVRFVRIAKESAYDLVVGNPPYQGLSKSVAFGYVPKTYPRGKTDLYSAFLERGLDLAKPSGISALLTMRGWMFQGQFTDLREHILREFDLRIVGDFDRGAFDEVPNELLAVAVSVIRRTAHPNVTSVSLLPTPLADKSYERGRTDRKRAAVITQVGRYEFDPLGFRVIKGEPIVYWWDRKFLATYAATPKLGEKFPGLVGLRTSDNARFLRYAWECHSGSLLLRRFEDETIGGGQKNGGFVPYIKGARGRAWFEDVGDVARWHAEGFEYRVAFEYKYKGFTSIQNRACYFRPGIAFSMIGNSFSARAHRFQSIVGHKGASLFPSDVAGTLCLLNSSLGRWILSSLNPGLGFEVGDVNRVPVLPVPDSGLITATLNEAFTQHEQARECSVEFVRPGVSAWKSAERWAQLAVDCIDGDPLPRYNPEYEAPTAESFVSFAVGCALGRFASEDVRELPSGVWKPIGDGIIFISVEAGDSLDRNVCVQVIAAWDKHGEKVGNRDDLRTYLRKSFFGFHKKLYENRPIYFPLSSAKKNFVAFISIHRWQDDTLNVLLADYLIPARRRLEGEIEDLHAARSSGSNKGQAEKRFTEVKALFEELNEFIAKVTQIGEKGPPLPDTKVPPREVDARLVMDLDDGVMVNSAALWPLLEPQWKDPKKWWKELATAQGKKDYDWSHLAARYFPTRVRKKCHDDPSLAVAHKCFWELHPAKAYAWELRLQDEIRPDFTIDEPNSDAAQEKFLAEHQQEAAEILATETKRRERKAAKAEGESEAATLFDEEGDEPEEADGE